LFHTVPTNGMLYDTMCAISLQWAYSSFGRLVLVLWLGAEYTKPIAIRQMTNINNRQFVESHPESQRQHPTIGRCRSKESHHTMKTNHQSTTIITRSSLLLLLTIETFPSQEQSVGPGRRPHCGSCGAVIWRKCILTCFFKHCISCSKSKHIHDAVACLGSASLATGRIWNPVLIPNSFIFSTGATNGTATPPMVVSTQPLFIQRRQAVRYV
jgi:hypothetical protein